MNKEVLFICDTPPYEDEYVDFIAKMEYEVVCNSLADLEVIPKKDIKHIVMVGVSLDAIEHLSILFVEKGFKTIIDLEGCPKMCEDDKEKWIAKMIEQNVMVLE